VLDLYITKYAMASGTAIWGASKYWDEKSPTRQHNILSYNLEDKWLNASCQTKKMDRKTRGGKGGRGEYKVHRKVATGCTEQGKARCLIWYIILAFSWKKWGNPWNQSTWHVSGPRLEPSTSKIIGGIPTWPWHSATQYNCNIMMNINESTGHVYRPAPGLHVMRTER
jgi:hypothetical protein